MAVAVEIDTGHELAVAGGPHPRDRQLRCRALDVDECHGRAVDRRRRFAGAGDPQHEIFAVGRREARVVGALAAQPVVVPDHAVEIVGDLPHGAVRRIRRIEAEEVHPAVGVALRAGDQQWPVGKAGAGR